MSGSTALLFFSKFLQVFEALGATDELSSHLGLVIAMAERSKHPYASQLQRVQCLLQDIGSCVATPLPTASPAQLGNRGVHFFQAGLLIDLEKNFRVLGQL